MTTSHVDRVSWLLQMSLQCKAGLQPKEISQHAVETHCGNPSGMSAKCQKGLHLIETFEMRLSNDATVYLLVQWAKGWAVKRRDAPEVGWTLQQKSVAPSDWLCGSCSQQAGPSAVGAAVKDCYIYPLSRCRQALILQGAACCEHSHDQHKVWQQQQQHQRFCLSDWR